jgi:glycosyltransferase involved in cell wall biosynthesis
MRIGLNLLHALPEIGGVWNYIEELLAALAKCDAGNSYVAFVTGASESLVPQSRNFERVVVRIRSAWREWRVVYENTMLQVPARRRNLDCMHWFSATHGWFNSVPSAVTFYDMQAFLSLARFTPVKRRYLQTAMRRTVRQAQVLLPMSHSTAADLCHVLGANRERITVIPPVVPPSFCVATRAQSAGFRRRYGLPEQYWLDVAHYYPHKNHRVLLQAYRRLRDTGMPAWPLVLRGNPRGAEREIEAALSELELRDSVLQLPPLPRAELPGLYAAASALVSPSVYEGAGIPVIEAMSCGCPVTASGIPALREFAGEAALYFDPTDEASIAGAMQLMQEDPARRQELREAGLRRSELYWPEAVAPLLTQAYRQASSSAQLGKHGSTGHPSASSAPAAGASGRISSG